MRYNNGKNGCFKGLLGSHPKSGAVYCVPTNSKQSIQYLYRVEDKIHSNKVTLKQASANIKEFQYVQVIEYGHLAVISKNKDDFYRVSLWKVVSFQDNRPISFTHELTLDWKIIPTSYNIKNFSIDWVKLGDGKVIVMFVCKFIVIAKFEMSTSAITKEWEVEHRINGRGSGNTTSEQNLGTYVHAKLMLSSSIDQGFYFVGSYDWGNPQKHYVQLVVLTNNTQYRKFIKIAESVKQSSHIINHPLSRKVNKETNFNGKGMGNLSVDDFWIDAISNWDEVDSRFYYLITLRKVNFSTNSGAGFTSTSTKYLYSGYVKSMNPIPQTSHFIISSANKKNHPTEWYIEFFEIKKNDEGKQIIKTAYWSIGNQHKGRNPIVFFQGSNYRQLRY